jgi:hypothetical protein
MIVCANERKRVEEEKEVGDGVSSGRAGSPGFKRNVGEAAVGCGLKS